MDDDEFVDWHLDWDVLLGANSSSQFHDSLHALNGSLNAFISFLRWNALWVVTEMDALWQGSCSFWHSFLQIPVHVLRQERRERRHHFAHSKQHIEQTCQCKGTVIRSIFPLASNRSLSDVTSALHGAL